MFRITSLLLMLGLVTTVAGAPLPEKVEPKERAVPKELLQAQLEAAQDVFKARWAEFMAGRSTGDEVQVWARRLLDARLPLAATRAERVASCKEYLDQMKEWEKLAKARYDAGRVSIAEYKAASYYRIEAEILLFKSEAK